MDKDLSATWGKKSIYVPEPTLPTGPTPPQYLIRFNIVVAFNNLYIVEGSREATTFKTYFDTYKYKVIPFRLTSRLFF